MSEQSTAARMLLPRDEPVQLVDPSGTAHADPQYKPATKDRLLDGYRALVVGRRVNDQCNALVRQGRLAVYPSSHGQEACQVAAVMALADQDWIFPTYRDSMAIPLIPLLSENFSRVVYATTRQLDRALIEREKPDIVIEELVERSLNAPGAFPMK